MTKISSNSIITNHNTNLSESYLAKVWRGLKITSHNGLEFASSATRNFLNKSSEVANDVIQNKNLYVTEVSKEFKETTVKSLGFVALGVAAFSLIDTTFWANMRRLELDQTAPYVPEFLQDFSKNVSFLEGSLPADKRNISRLLINRPLFFGTLLFGLTQEGLLKKLPEKILKKVAPSQASLVNSRLARMTRIALTAFIYSLASSLEFSSFRVHPNLYSVSKANLIWKFVEGAMCGSVQELTGNPLYSMATLLGWNLSLSVQQPLIPVFPYYRT